MGIIAKLKDALGIADRGGRRGAEPADVTVERETDTASERAVKGVDEPSTEPGDSGPVPGAAGADEGPTGDGEPVDAIKGIGSSYAERLGEAGVHTVDDLAAADADDLSEETGIGAGRIANWIERAKVRNR